MADAARQTLNVAWESAAESERTSRTKYAQSAIHPDDVAREVAEVRAALGGTADVEDFVRESLSALGATLTGTADGFTATLGALPAALRSALARGTSQAVSFRRSPPVARHEVLLARTSPGVEAIAAYVLDAALDPAALPGDLARRLARRAGVFRTQAVRVRTTMLLLRHRLHLTLPGREQTRLLVAEDAEVVAFTGRPDAPVWLPDDAVADLLAAPAHATGNDGLARDALERARAGLAGLQPALDARGDALAERLLGAHRRVRETAGGMLRRGLAVQPIRPADVLGLYVYLPAAVS
jgi:hypothetical protein